MSTWLLTMKPSFLSEWSALPAKEAAQVQKKLASLVEDPAPDAKTKKQLKGWDGKLYRLRSGDYRIFYTMAEPYVSILALRRRSEDTYDEDIAAEELGGGSVDVPGAEAPRDTHWNRWLTPRALTGPTLHYLPAPITRALLEALRVPAEHHAALLAVDTEDALLECASVPEEVRLRVIDALVGRPLEEVAQQPDLVLDRTEDLLRYKEGELMGFLLRLDAEQERFVTWGASAAGPTLLKGGPGTGKSTVALYRARTMIDRLRREGAAQPRVLFTTYTRALMRWSEQLLGSLLGADAALVEVRTADSVALGVVRQLGVEPALCQGSDLAAALERAVAGAEFAGNALQVAAQRQTIEQMERGYLLDEILGVIQGRRLATLSEYQAAARPGRRVALGKTQRQAVWAVHQALARLLGEAGQMTWPMMRAAAAGAIERGQVSERYDAVIIDEAQDLDPAALQVLVGLCASPGRLFLTADANQSIYGAGFRWSDVHAWLRFTGRTGVLRANHRSTREIDEAAHQYLAGAGGDGAAALVDELDARQHVHTGPVPAVRAVAGPADEVALLQRFFPAAARELRLGLGACAVLCPTQKAAQRVAAELQQAGLPAGFMAADRLDLGAPGIKTLTLKSAKGLEFPIVAVAGFGDAPYPYAPRGLGADERAELVERERRTMFVAMTRAMRALLVVVPADTRSELLGGFDATRWNLGEPHGR